MSRDIGRVYGLEELRLGFGIHSFRRSQRRLCGRNSQASRTGIEDFQNDNQSLITGDLPQSGKGWLRSSAFRIINQQLQLRHGGSFPPDTEGSHRTRQKTAIERGKRLDQCGTSKGITDILKSGARVRREFLIT